MCVRTMLYIVTCKRRGIYDIEILMNRWTSLNLRTLTAILRDAVTLQYTRRLTVRLCAGGPDRTCTRCTTHTRVHLVTVAALTFSKTKKNKKRVAAHTHSYVNVRVVFGGKEGNFYRPARIVLRPARDGNNSVAATRTFVECVECRMPIIYLFIKKYTG